METNPKTWVKDSLQYFTEVQGEYRKITWPSQNEALRGSIGVIVVVSIITIVLSLIDFSLSHVVQYVFD